MADIQLLQESRAIIREMGIKERGNPNFLCPILRILQMRHYDLDTAQAKKIIKKVLND